MEWKKKIWKDLYLEPHSWHISHPSTKILRNPADKSIKKIKFVKEMEENINTILA